MDKRTLTYIDWPHIEYNKIIFQSKNLKAENQIIDYKVATVFNYLRNTLGKLRINRTILICLD